MAPGLATSEESSGLAGLLSFSSRRMPRTGAILAMKSFWAALVVRLILRLLMQ